MALTASLLSLIFIQTVKFVEPSCDQNIFGSNVDICLSEFNRSMETRGGQDRCPWPAAKRLYYKLKLCVDDWAKATRCHGFLVDEIFLEVHNYYFSHCGQVQDPPLFTLIMLIVPVIIATLTMPILCSTLVTWNT